MPRGHWGLETRSCDKDEPKNIREYVMCDGSNTNEKHHDDRTFCGGGPAKRSCKEKLQREVAKRSCEEKLQREVAKRSCKREAAEMCTMPRDAEMCTMPGVTASI